MTLALQRTCSHSLIFNNPIIKSNPYISEDNSVGPQSPTLCMTVQGFTEAGSCHPKYLRFQSLHTGDHAENPKGLISQKPVYIFINSQRHTNFGQSMSYQVSYVWLSGPQRSSYSYKGIFSFLLGIISMCLFSFVCLQR